MPVSREQVRPAAVGARVQTRWWRAASRVLVLVMLASLALPASAMGASAAQPSGVGNAHLAPQSAEAHQYRLVGQVLPRGDEPPPENHDTAWLPLLILGGLLLAGGGGYLVHARRRAA
ncbi:hypothetical protein [Amycolatopsis sp. FDAARGOS 1241]|uniref:hypothetical protein n=1 Tax=Amycolatopsis sp. FDAARGOS 1241 TaxID=2778070 RepID=UPI001EF1B486|nr:hypothetical protein [Amycolatopsis sp. FDAARGOS 1241]